MPIIYRKIIAPDASIGIWEIKESLNELLIMSGLNEMDEEKKKFKSPHRKKEQAATLLLCQEMIANSKKLNVDYDENDKPRLKGLKKHISISHTKQFVAVFIHDKNVVGVDIELVLPRIEKISKRFLNDKENKWIEEQNHLEQLYVIWGAKECAFKIYSKGGIDFKKMLEVKKFEYEQNGNTLVTLKKNNVLCEYPVYWENLNGLMLVFAHQY